jgi:VanZ family protein
MTIIFLLSSRQRISISEQYWANFFIFKSLHVIEYAILAALNTVAIATNTKVVSLNRAVLYGAFFALLYAISDEYHQTLVPTRSGQARDVLIDSIGIFSVYWLISFYEKSKKRPSAPLRSRTS